MQSKRIELLQRMPVFGAMCEEALCFLLELSTVRTVPSGAFFFREGDPAASMFVLEAGSVSVIKSAQGRDFVLHGLDAGDCFGEMALMDLLPRSASVRADEDCQAMEITTDNLLQLFEHDPEQFALIQMNIGREVCRRLRATNELLFQARMGQMQSIPEALFRAA